MKPQKQLYRHKPEEGVYGDCHRTAIAVILDLDAADVPHFMGPEAYDEEGGGRRAFDHIEAWLNERGLATARLPFPGEISPLQVLDTIASCNPASKPAFILTGTSRTGFNHSVVACDGAIVCDPHPDDVGILGPCADGYFWITFFVHLDATKDPARRSGNVALEEDVAA